MVRHVIHSAAKEMGVVCPVHLVTASRGKAVRAEPVAGLYEQGKVKHVGRFPVLEDQLLNFSTNGWLGEKSPDRADGAIWAVSSLLVKLASPVPVVAPILVNRTRVLLGEIPDKYSSGTLTRI